MNDISDFAQCSNCGACYNSCPVGAISVHEDGMFYDVVVDEAKCISCGLCKKVCPVNTPKQVQNTISAYAAIHHSPAIVKASSSGGAFTAIAEWVLGQGGVVFGAAYSDDCRSVEMNSTEKVSLEQLQKSKYVESKPGFSFKEVKTHLDKEDRYVLYCGTPCQIAGLKRYLRKDYEKLITCDFSCGGMPSHRIYGEYLDMIEKKLGARVCEVNFRPKTYGWLYHAIKITAENGRQYSRWAMADPYFDCFIGRHLKHSVRDYCLSCQFANNHYADLILADFWRYKTLSKIKNGNQGISLVITNSRKGEEVVRRLSETMSLTMLDLSPSSYNLRRKDFTHLLPSKARFLEKCEKNGFARVARTFRYPSQLSFLLKYYIKKLLNTD